MKLTKITNFLTKTAGRTGLLLSKYSPEILLTVGIAGVVTSAILACRATMKAQDVIEEHEDKLDEIQRNVRISDEGTGYQYPVDNQRRDTWLVYAQTSLEWIKLYGPSVSLGLGSIACILASYKIVHKRSVAIMAAYKTVEEAFSKYRQRVKEEYGEEKEYMIRHGLKSEQIIEEEVDEDGKKHKVKKTKYIGSSDLPSPYARWFDNSVIAWSDKDPSYNYFFVRSNQNFFNDLLNTRGHVFLNEVYDAFGFDRTYEGAVVGWALHHGGDDFIDFDVFDENNQAKRAFVNGHGEAILLDFNVDGFIHDILK